MKTRLVVGFLIIAVIASSIIAAVTLTMSKPEKTLENFITSMKDYDFEAAKLSYSDSIEEDKKVSSDIAAKNELQGLKEYEDLEEEFKKLMKKLNYTILSKEVNKEKKEATLNIQMDYIDVSDPMVAAVESIFAEMFDGMFSGKEYTEEEVEVMTVVKTTENLKNFENKISSAVGDIHFVKENKEWKISSIDDNILKALAFGVFQDNSDDEENQKKKSNEENLEEAKKADNKQNKEKE